MKLNVDCVRGLLLALEDAPRFGENLSLQSVDFDWVCNNKHVKKFLREDIAYTSEKLDEAEFIQVQFQYYDMRFYGALYSGLTYEGHQFLESVRDPQMLRTTKKICGQLGLASLKFVSAVSEGVATAALNKMLFSN